MRSIKYRYLKADKRRLLTYINHLSTMLSMLVNVGSSDSHMLDMLTTARAELELINKALLKEN